VNGGEAATFLWSWRARDGGGEPAGEMASTAPVWCRSFRAVADCRAADEGGCEGRQDSGGAACAEFRWAAAAAAGRGPADAGAAGGGGESEPAVGQ